MVSGVIWSPEARAALDESVDWLAERDDRAALKLRADVEEWTERIAKHLLGTPHNWPGCRTAGYPDQHKRIIYRVREDAIEVVVRRDTRQYNNLYDFGPKPK